MSLTTHPIQVPDRFAKDTITREGKAGKTWIEALPRIVETRCRQWRLAINGPVRHGYTGLAIPVQRDDEAFVLKVYWRDSDTDTAVLALTVWNGQGAAKVLAYDPEAGAMLLEKLDPHASLENVAIGAAIEIAGRLLRRLAIPAPDNMPTITDLAARMRQLMPQRWAQYGRPFSRQLLDEVCDQTEQLGATSTNLMTDYDLHYTDILAGQREPWLMIDPKAIAGDPEFSLAQLLWTRLEDIEAGKGIEYHFQALVEAAKLDEALARRWTIIRCADYWLWGLTVGLTHDPVRCRRIIACLKQNGESSKQLSV